MIMGYIVSGIELITAAVLGYAGFRLFRSGERYQITGIGLGIMSFAFIIKSIFNYLQIYASSSWGLVEAIDLIGAIIVVWSIIHK